MGARSFERGVLRLLVTALVLAGVGCGGEAMMQEGSGGRGGTGGGSAAGGASGIAGAGSGGDAGGASGAGGGTAVGGTSGIAGAGSGGDAGGASGTGGVAAGGRGGDSGRGGASGGRGGASGAASAGTDGGAPDGGASDGGSAGSGGAGGTGSGGAGGGGVVAAGVRWFGRVDIATPTRPRFSWSGTGFIARFTGTGLSAQISNGGTFRFRAVVDGTPQTVFTSTSGQATYSLASGLASGMHTVELHRQTEGAQGDSQLIALTVTGGALVDPPAGPARLIEVIGDSITCGYGTLGTLNDADCFPTESHWDSYGAIAARAVGAEVSTIASSGQGIYRNYGGDMTNTIPMIYGRTLTSSATPAWDFRTQPQAVVINLGTNDISNNKGDPGTAFRTLYTTLLQTVRQRYPQAYIICLIAPLLSGTELTTIKGHISAAVAARMSAGDARVEFFDGIAPQTSDKAACQYHPNVAQQTLMGNALAAELRAKLGW